MLGCRVISIRALCTFASLALASLAGCDRAPEPSTTKSPPPPPAIATTAVTTAAPIATLSAKLTRPAPARLVAIGDLHGDLAATKRTLRLAGAIDDKDAWIGGALVVVQTGDEIDRGDDDRAILDLTERLRDE